MAMKLALARLGMSLVLPVCTLVSVAVELPFVAIINFISCMVQ